MCATYYVKPQLLLSFQIAQIVAKQENIYTMLQRERPYPSVDQLPIHEYNLAYFPLYHYIKEQSTRH